MQQVLRTLATAWALATNLAPLLGAESAYGGRFVYRLESLEAAGFPIAGVYQDWLEGELTTDFADAFIGPILDTQSASGHAGDPDETRKLLRSVWANEIMRNGVASDAPRNHENAVGVTVRAPNGTPLANATVAAVSSNGTAVTGVTDTRGNVLLRLVSGKTYTGLVAHPGYLGRTVTIEIDADSLTVSLARAAVEAGSIIGHNGIAYIPGLVGRINAIHDSLDRRYLYAENISINESTAQPYYYQTNATFALEDSSGTRCRATVLFSLGTTFLLNYQFE